MASLMAFVVAENDPIPQPECDANKTVSIRYASTTARLYLEAAVSGDRGGCVTLTDIFEARAGQGPLYPVDPADGTRVEAATGTWLLTEDLYIEDGITLNVSRQHISGNAGRSISPVFPLNDDALRLIRRVFRPRRSEDGVMEAECLGAIA